MVDMKCVIWRQAQSGIGPNSFFCCFSFFIFYFPIYGKPKFEVGHKFVFDSSGHCEVFRELQSHLLTFRCDSDAALFLAYRYVDFLWRDPLFDICAPLFWA